ncbi:hypothetical protein [Aliiruegeria lutimaris]|uniref:Hpt domain-containing protein n=1 Tax=Aliiruegeria lutimaris TaxID=571298 RepID=A0A1G9CMV3_9RHOB|nr:hypothetical protein [Aliiruegeria lutimaris]SDK52916.1 hypothetical protein SAMN04488026_10444 [Aliiruegeria lutimaris]
MANYAKLDHDEPIRLDPDSLEALYLELGPAGAENVVCRAMEELALRLSDLPKLHRAGRWDKLSRIARSMIAIARQVGLTGFARVAGDVAKCAVTGDPIALSATLSRLERIGERSLTAVWDLQDPPI